MAKAYWINMFRSVRDEEKLASYIALAGPAMLRAGGRFLARGLPVRVFESGLMQRATVIEFDSAEQAAAAYESDEYQEALRVLGDAAERDLRIVEGTDVSTLVSARVRLRPGGAGDVPALVRIRSTPEVRARWRGTDLEAEVAEDLSSDEFHTLVIEDQSGATIGAIQWHEETEPDYRHASVDIFLDPSVHGQGYGTEAVHTLVRHLFEARGHHRLTIDPATDNDAAIGCYAKVGFRPVGVMRQYERGLDGTWHDGLLMELLAEDFHSYDFRATPSWK